MTGPDYDAFIYGKLSRVPPTGLAVVPELHASLFPHQRDLVAWALRRGRAAIFADTGLGKSACQLEWARHVCAHTGRNVLILAPLAVAAQTVREGQRMGIPVMHVDHQTQCAATGIHITNYDKLHRFDAASFEGVVLDESSVIKHVNSKRLAEMLVAFRDTAFKLCATATPSPNDFTELGTHAEFLGICTRAEMLAEFFCHDGGETQKWRVKGHAVKPFWSWIASWAALVRSPADLGYDATAYDLPPLKKFMHVTATSAEDVRESGFLFAQEATDLSSRRTARRQSITTRVEQCAAIVNAEPDQAWVVWCDLNDESDMLTKSIHGAVEVRGSMSSEEKEAALIGFSTGQHRVIVTKSSISGFGLNWQHAARMAFVGVTDSWESYYQAVRRCWRFGQKRPVHVHVFASEAEGAVTKNLERKERDAKIMSDELSAATRDALRAEIHGLVRATNPYAPTNAIHIPAWLKTETEST